MSLSSHFNGKTSNTPRGGDYDFLNGVFEWVFYSLPPRADNTFIRNMYEFYTSRGGLSKKQLEALLATVKGIGAVPPFNPATLEAIIKKKGSKLRSPLPAPTPLYKEETSVKQQLDTILAFAPAHKAAQLFLNKLQLHQPLSPADRDMINKIFAAVSAKQK